MMRGPELLALGSALALVTISAPAVAAQFDPRASVTQIRRLLQQNYVVPETRAKLDAALAEGLAAGRYDVNDPAQFADRVNADLDAVSHDKHLGLMFNPKAAAELAAQPSGAGADDAPPSPQEILAAQRNNHGLVEMKLLPGNVRYLEVRGFQWAGPTTAKAYDDALRFLKGGDAIIIDIRRNGGGSPEAVQYLVSHFLEPNRPIMTFYMGADQIDRVSSLAKLPVGTIRGKPLYVLTSGNSASAAEEFAGHVDGFKLGELIGETTAGAGFRNEYFPVADQFLFSISVGRAVLASTGKDWEGVGIAPTTTVASGKALEVAQVHALRKLAATAKPSDKKALEAAATLLSAQIQPVKTTLSLPAYAGTFGDRNIVIEDGKLTYRRGGGPKVGLIPVGANEFAFEHDPEMRLLFAVSGAGATSFDLMRPDGSRVTAARTE